MAFKINVDKYGYSASPEKVSGNYAAELAKKLFKDEAEARASAVSGVGADLSREVLDRKNAVQAVTADLTAEGEVRAAQDTAIRADLKSATESLSADLANEMKTRAAQDTAIRADLKNATESLSADLANEIKTRTAQDAELRTALNTEISEAVKTLRNEVDGKADKATTLAGYGITDGVRIIRVRAIVDFDTYIHEGIYSIANPSGGGYAQCQRLIVLHRYGSNIVSDDVDGVPCDVIQILLGGDASKTRIGRLLYVDVDAVGGLGTFELRRVWSEWSDYLTSENAYTKDEVNLHVENLIRACSHLQEQINEKPSYDDLRNVTDALSAALYKKADSPKISSTNATEFTFDFSEKYNSELRVQNASAVSIKFANEAYGEDYISGLSFDSGETPTMFDYTDSGIINWVGTDCSTIDGLSIFQPSANTHYDIVFYFNGSQFIGLVNGFVPATGNVVSE